MRRRTHRASPEAIERRREEVASLCEEGLTTAAIARRLSLHYATVRNDLRMLRRQGRALTTRPYEPPLEQTLLAFEEGWRRFQAGDYDNLGEFLVALRCLRARKHGEVESHLGLDAGSLADLERARFTHATRQLVERLLRYYGATRRP